MVTRVSFLGVCLSLCMAGCFIEPHDEPLPLFPGEGPRVPAPRFTTRTTAHTPPPLSGGTLIVLPDDRTVAASDPDHDVVWLADTVGGTEGRSVALQAGDEPGRLAVDGAGHLFVALRRGGAVATIDPVAGTVTARRNVCPAPRGLSWDTLRMRLIVVCEGGEFVSLPAEGEAMEQRQLEGDLRDVAVINGRVYVSHFRSALTDRVEDSGRVTPLTNNRTFTGRDTVTTAWRTVPLGSSLVMLSQQVQAVTLGTSNDPSDSSSRGYGQLGTNQVPVMPRVSIHSTDGGSSIETGLTMGGLAIDIAAREAQDGLHIAVVSPGWAYGQGVPQVNEWTVSSQRGSPNTFSTQWRSHSVEVSGQAVAAAYTRDGWLVVQTRAPGSIVVGRRTIPLYRDEVSEVGHDVFHATTPSGLACASCHPEGGDDGHVWNFQTIGERRTPSLRGGILETAPFHWDGDMRDMGHLMTSVFSARMGAGAIAPAHATAVAQWIQTVPTVARVRGPVDAVARGEALFRSPEVGCAGCHSGAKFTNNQTMDVGTGGRFQVPPLVGLAARAPYMHAGCATTLHARFIDTQCGGGDAHGHTSQLTSTELDDLVTYLTTL
jgi:mono/diheme cytochrome c family protein